MTPHFAPDALARSAIERSRLYSLLATVFRREPSAEFLCELRSPELVVAMAGAGVDPGKGFEQTSFAELADLLAIEFTRLFLGPGKHISPHESVQLKRGSDILWGPETVAVRKAYRAAGFDLEESATEIPDHLSVELDFLALLASEEARAWKDGDPGRTEKVLILQLEFISKHLGKWAARFSAEVKEKAEFAFYPAFAELLSGFMAGEKLEISRRLRAVEMGDPLENSRRNENLETANQ